MTNLITKCLHAPSADGNSSGKEPFCKDCFVAILNQTRKDLNELQRMVEGSAC